MSSSNPKILERVMSAMTKKSKIVAAAAVAVAGVGLNAVRKSQTTKRQQFESMIKWFQTSKEAIPTELRTQCGEALQDCYIRADLAKLLSKHELARLENAYRIHLEGGL